MSLGRNILIGGVLVGLVLWGWSAFQSSQTLSGPLRVASERYAAAAKGCEEDGAVREYWADARSEIVAVASQAMPRASVSRLVTELEGVAPAAIGDDTDPLIVTQVCDSMTVPIARDYFRRIASREGFRTE